MRINLSTSELFVCRMLGMMRRSTAMNRVGDQQMGDQDTWAIDIDGVVGEFCVAKALNLCPDFSVSVRSGGSDLVTHDKQTIDVKTTRVKGGRLLATLKKADASCDLYYLVIVDDFGGDLVGYINKEKLFVEENKKDIGHGIGYIMSQDQLNRVEL
jgi:hypothetical protein